MTEHYSHVDRAEKLRAADRVVALAGLRNAANDNTSPRNAPASEEIRWGTQLTSHADHLRPSPDRVSQPR